MKKYTLSKILDFIFKTTLTFFIFFVWINFYVQVLYLSLFLSVLSTFLFTYIFTALKNKKYATQKLNKEETELLQLYTNEFLFSEEEENLRFFEKLLQKKHTVKLEQNFIIIEKENYKIILIPYYKTRKLTMDTATNLYIRARKKEANKLIITCKTCDQEVLNFSKQLKIIKLIVLDEKQTFFKLLKPYEQYPEIKNKLIEENKLTFSQFLYIMFERKKTKSYFWSGTILLLGSFIVRYNLYYIIFSSLLYFMALYSYFNVSFNKKLPENIIDEEQIKST